MVTIEKLKSIINGRKVCILAHGKSIQELEDQIEQFRNQDVCWISFSVFPIMEKFILSKIGKKLDIVFDCATVPHARTEHYELTQRVPRLQEFLRRPDNNLWITSNGIIRDSVTLHYPNFLDEFNDKILLVDHLFPRDSIAKYMDVPNSICFVIACALAGGASQVIIFGLDGSKSSSVDSYYHHEFHMIERKASLGDYEDIGIPRDTKGFEERIPSLVADYRKIFNNNADVFNCSPITLYTSLPKINYQELEKIL